MAADGLLVVPLNTLDKWYDKFLRKYDLDPNFVYKTNEWCIKSLCMYKS